MTRRDALGVMLGSSGFISALRVLPGEWAQPSVQAAPIQEELDTMKVRGILDDTTTTTTFILPIELSSFRAVVVDDEVKLSWTTDLEVNNAGFSVLMRSREDALHGGSDWEDIGFVEGHGSSNVARHYEYRVRDLEPGRYRFRLKQIDFDGSYSYSSEVEIRLDELEGFRLTPGYPNPFSQASILELSVSEQQHVRVEVFNQLGRKVSVLYDDLMRTGQTETLRFEANQLSNGVYVVRANGDKFSTVRMVTLVR